MTHAYLQQGGGQMGGGNRLRGTEGSSTPLANGVVDIFGKVLCVRVRGRQTNVRQAQLRFMSFICTPTYRQVYPLFTCTRAHTFKPSHSLSLSLSNTTTHDDRIVLWRFQGSTQCLFDRHARISRNTRLLESLQPRIHKCQLVEEIFRQMA